MKTIANLSAIICAAIAVGSITPSASAANLVVNGGFENPADAVPDNDWRYFGGQNTSGSKYGGPTVEGWENINETSTIEIRDDKVGKAKEGQHFAEVDSHAYDKNEPVGFFQDIVTEVGKKYKLSFYFGPRQGYTSQGNDNQLNVSFGSIDEMLDAGVSGVDDAWQLFEGYITATDTKTRLQFDLQGIPNTLGANLDDIHVTAVPEPLSVLGLAAIGLLGTAGAVHKRTATRG
ncbi:MAG: hypothetical protein ACFBSG_19085 [Leptolyngbyaceae cyanobacterium]